MTLDQIDAFLAVIEHGNFAGAASSLYLTQSALGHRISNLEKELDIELFMRARGVRRVELTHEGNQFIPLAQQMKDIWEQALALSGAGRDKEVRIAFIFSAQLFLVPYLLPILHDAGLRPHIVSSRTASSIKMLRDGELDFAMIGGYSTHDEDSFMSELLGREGLVFVSSPNSPYGDRVSIKDLDPGKEVYSMWSTANESWHLRVFGDGFSPLVTIESAGQVSPMLETNPELWALVPAGYAAKKLAAGELRQSNLDERPPARDIQLLSRRPIQTECYNVLSQALRERLSQMEGFTPAS